MPSVCILLVQALNLFLRMPVRWFIIGILWFIHSCTKCQCSSSCASGHAERWGCSVGNNYIEHIITLGTFYDESLPYSKFSVLIYLSALGP